MGEFINVLVSKGKSNLIPEKDNLYGQFVGEWDFEWVDNQGTTGERHVQGEWIFAWVLEGTAIQDVFICPSRKARIKDYQPDAAYATAVRMYNPNTEAWDILYTELGGATQLEGKREGNRIVQTEINLGPTPEVNSLLESYGSTPLNNGIKMADVIKRPEMDYDKLAPIDFNRPELPDDVREQVNIQIKYEGYITRQQHQVQQFKKLEARKIPEDIDYEQVMGLRIEARQKCSEVCIA